MSQNALAAIDFNQLPALSMGSEEIFDEISQGAEYLGRLQLFGSSSKPCKKGQIKPGHFGIPVSADEVIDLGPVVDLLAIARRPKAIDMSDKPVVSTYDENDPEFKRIAAQSKVKDSKCQFGPSFLVIERTTNRLLEYFLGSPTHRPEAKKIYPNLPVTENQIAHLKESGADVSEMVAHGPIPFTVKSYLVEREYSWHVPQVYECSSPFTKLPKAAVIQAEIVKFLTAKSEVEAEPEDEKPAKSKRAR